MQDSEGRGGGRESLKGGGVVLELSSHCGVGGHIA